MLIKLTVAGRNETTFVNFDYVRTMRRDGAFTELVMSDDKYHKLAVMETPDEIYDILYPPKPCTVSYCSGAENKVNNTPAQVVETIPETASVKKPTPKKASTKTVEER
jgi:hypothetical protein